MQPAPYNSIFKREKKKKKEKGITFNLKHALVDRNKKNNNTIVRTTMCCKNSKQKFYRTKSKL
jgi:hypothetical protein